MDIIRKAGIKGCLFGIIVDFIIYGVLPKDA